jgi:RNA polymerase sigma-70 factor, ECF subfamily
MQVIEEWVEQCRKGQSRAFAHVVREMQQRVYCFLYRMTQNREQAEDLAQETFLRAYRQLANYDCKKAAFSTWLFTLARNLCLDDFRRRKPTQTTLEEAVNLEAASGFTPYCAANDKEIEQKIAQAVESLGTTFREVFVLYEYEDLPLEQIAVVVGRPVGTVKSRLHRARLQLQEKLSSVLYV